jgi:FkbM family methyltransferase
MRTAEVDDCVYRIGAIDFSCAVGTQFARVIESSSALTYEPETLSASISLIDFFGISEFGDIGANVGYYALAIKKVFGSCVSVQAFEAMPKLCGVIRDLCQKNSIEVTINEVAISDKDGEATFYLSSRSDMSNSLNPNFRKPKGLLQVTTRAFDSFSRETGFRPGLLKIDTETTEPAVLAGARDYIDRYRPFIVCEILPGRTEHDVQAFIEGIGYTPYHITGDDFSSVGRICGNTQAAHRDWLLSPHELNPDFNGNYKKWFSAVKGFQGHHNGAKRELSFGSEHLQKEQTADAQSG